MHKKGIVKLKKRVLKDLKSKIDDVTKLHKTREFEKAMSYDAEPEPIKWQQVKVEESYSGPKFEKIEEINAEWYDIHNISTL